MTDDTDAVRRRTVLQRAAAGLGGALAVGAAATDEAAASICVEVIDGAQTYTSGCPPAFEDFFASAGERGYIAGGCTAGSVTYDLVDWHLHSGSTYIDEEEVEIVNCEVAP